MSMSRLPVWQQGRLGGSKARMLAAIPYTTITEITQGPRNQRTVGNPSGVGAFAQDVGLERVRRGAG